MGRTIQMPIRRGRKVSLLSVTFFQFTFCMDYWTCCSVTLCSCILCCLTQIWLHTTYGHGHRPANVSWRSAGFYVRRYETFRLSILLCLIYFISCTSVACFSNKVIVYTPLFVALSNCELCFLFFLFFAIDHDVKGYITVLHLSVKCVKLILNKFNYSCISCKVIAYFYGLRWRGGKGLTSMAA